MTLPLYDSEAVRYFPCGERKLSYDHSMQCYKKVIKISAAYNMNLLLSSEICGSPESMDLGWGWLEEVGSAPLLILPGPAG